MLNLSFHAEDVSSFLAWTLHEQR